MSGVSRMAGKKKSGERKEPLFGLPAALHDLRLSIEDRIAGPAEDKPNKSPPAKRVSDDGGDKPPARSTFRDISN